MVGVDEVSPRVATALEPAVPPFHPDQLDVYLRRRNGGGGMVYLALVLLLIAMAAALPLVEIPISVHGQGILRAKAESHALIAPSSGEVAWVIEGQRKQVAGGDTILLLRRPDLRVRLAATRASRLSLEQESVDLAQLIAWAEGGRPASRPISLRYHDDWQSVVVELQALAGRLRSSRREASRFSRLFERGLTSASEFAALDDRVQELRQDSIVLRARTAARWRGELARLHQELRDLQTGEATLAQESEQLAVTAPVAGTLDDVAALSTGSFVPAGQRVATLTPASPLVAELYVKPDELDGIRLGSLVRLRLASHRFARTGTVMGRVVEIEPELVRAGGGSAGRIRVEPGRSAGANAPRMHELRRGSSVTARIPVTRRSLWALLRHRRDNEGPDARANELSSERAVE